MTAYRPLAGTRVLDVAHLLPGALTTRRLADLGADVVKVELVPGADYLRQLPPRLEDGSITHALHDHGKRSIAFHRDDDAMAERVWELALAADVVVEGSRPGRIAALGLDLAELRKARPGIVVCSITGFGQTGPFALSPAHGMNIDALAGLLRVEDVDGRARLRLSHNLGLGVEFGALNAALAVTAAIACARVTGEGAWLDVSCWDAALEANRVELAELLTADTTSIVMSDMGPLYDVYLTADGHPMMFCAIEYQFWSKFCDRVGRLDLVERWNGRGDVDFGVDDELRAEIAGIMVGETAATWSARFLEWELPICEVLTPRQVLDHPHQRARQLVLEEGGVPRVRNAVRWVDHDGRPGDDLPPWAPEVGQHTDEVMADWLGKDQLKTEMLSVAPSTEET